MTRLVEWVAPRSWGDAVLKGAALITFINLVKFVVIVWILGQPYAVGRDLLIVLAISPPIVGVLMATLLRLRQLQHELTVLASTDMLTGLLIRRSFLERVAEVVRSGQPGALLALDADHFKRINDTWGHAVGDACLVAISDHLRCHVLEGDVVGRLGGEEFGVFLPNATRVQAVAMAERLCRAVLVEAEGLEQPLRLTLSVGAALSEDGLPLDRLMVRADQALYRAKSAGRARAVIWPEGCIKAESQAA